MRKNKSPKMHLAISGTRLVPEALIERRPLLRAEKKRGKRVKARLIESVVPSVEGTVVVSGLFPCCRFG